MTEKHLHNWNYLVARYFANTISKEELEELLEMAGKEEDRESLTEALQRHWEMAQAGTNTKTDAHWDAMFAEMMQKVESKDQSSERVKSPGTRKYLSIAAAAILLLAIGAAGYYYTYREVIVKETVKQPIVIKAPQDLLPGKMGAILTLADGKTISLDSAGDQVLAVQGKTTVSLNNGQVVYNGKKEGTAEVLYNTIETPRGRQFQLALADGSKVWLNAASTIRFPAAFDGRERKVDITGEAYFEIAEQYSPVGNGKVPFIVHVYTAEGDGGDITVLGTQFNVNTYDNTAQAKTTLLKGSVRVTKDHQEQILSPGQQAIVKAGKDESNAIRVLEKCDVDQVMAWKNGYFSFANTSLDGVMQQISRWYDVDIVYEGKIPERKFGGEISRNNNASQVLKILEESEVHFRIDGKKIIVMP